MKSFGAKPAGLRLERMKASPLWGGESFRNVHPVLPGLRDPGAPFPTISDFLCGGERRVPRGPLPSTKPTETWLKRPGTGLRVTWLGHSTVLIEIDGLRVLTDPVWGARASPSQLARPHRLHPPPPPPRAPPPLPLAAPRPQALPARARAAARAAAARPRARLARPLRPPRLPDDP